MMNSYAMENDNTSMMEDWQYLIDTAQDEWQIDGRVTAVHQHRPEADCALVPSAWPGWLICRQAAVIGSPTGAQPYEWRGPLT